MTEEEIILGDVKERKKAQLIATCIKNEGNRFPQI